MFAINLIGLSKQFLLNKANPLKKFSILDMWLGMCIDMWLVYVT